MKLLASVIISLVLLCPGLTSTTGMLFPQLKSANWSGYALQGSFTEVAGTFTVPSGASAAGCNSVLGEWVGVDGVANSDLIQAGISETEVNSTGNCTPNRVWVTAWWEILPGDEVPLEMTVAPGDSVTVSIVNVLAHEWLLSIIDTTNQQTFSHVFAYSGPGESVEWVMEAPSVFGEIMLLLPYGQTTFSNLHAEGTAALLDDVWLNQGNGPLSVPNSVANTNSLMTNGFTMVYTG